MKEGVKDGDTGCQYAASIMEECTSTLNARGGNKLRRGFCAILILYLFLQSLMAIVYLASRRGLGNFFGPPSVPTPYIAFLASLLTGSVKDMDRPCLWRIFRNRVIMSRLEKLLDDPQYYDEVPGFVAEKFKPCILHLREPNATDVIAGKHKKTNLDCFLQPDDLDFGPAINLDKPPPSLEEIGKEYPQLNIGGLYAGPAYCKRPRQSVAVIIPFRNREVHLRYFLHYMIGTLIRQQLQFSIFVVEQEGQGVFNKGQLMNTGFNWIRKQSGTRWDCYIFHDVDMILEVAGNIYMCRDEKYVNHLAPYIDKFNYTHSPKVGVTVGGAVAFTEWQYRAVNGYSNVYWGWGGEDDDMNVRIRLTGLKRTRPTAKFGRYKMIHHNRDTGNPKNLIRHKLLKTAKARMPVDGLSTLKTTIVQITRHPTHTQLLVRVDANTKPPPSAVVTGKAPVKEKNGTGIVENTKADAA